MKVFAINIFDFTNWYKFGIKSIPRSLLFDPTNTHITSEELIQKVGLFEEDYEVFFISVKQVLPNEQSEMFTASFYDIEKIIPLSHQASQLLKSKIPDFKLDTPLDESIRNKILASRNEFVSRQGGKILLSVFGLRFDKNLLLLEDDFYSSVAKYLKDLNFYKSNFIDYLISYERSKPFPVAEIGYLYDTGALLRTYFNLNDDDFRNRNALEQVDKPKSELVELLIYFSSFLQKCPQDIVWSELIQLIENDSTINSLNKEFSVASSFPNLNNILAAALFLRFRYQIRNSNNIEDKSFLKHIDRFVANLPEETSVALLMSGIFFGSLKFKDLAYKINPPAFSNLSYLHKPLVNETIKHVKPPVAPNPSGKTIDTSEREEQKIAPGSPLANASSFDEALLKSLKVSLKSFSKTQIAKVEKAFKHVQHFEGDMFTPQIDFLVACLRKNEKNSKAKKAESRLSEEQIILVKSELESLTK